MHSLIRDCMVPGGYRPNADLDMLASAFAKGVQRRIERIAAADDEARRLYHDCRHWLADLPLTCGWWEPEIGAALEHMDKCRPLAATVQGLLAAHAVGMAGEWRVEMPLTLRVSLCGHMFDLAGMVHVEAGDGKLGIRRHDAADATLEFVLVQDAWQLAHGCIPAQAWRYCPPSHLITAGFQGRYIQSWSLPANHRRGDDLMIDWPPQPVEERDQGLADSVATQVDNALALLGTLDATYLAWCKPLFRGLAACRNYDPQMRSSGSFKGHLGVISVGFPLKTPYLSEILVHELSHQYFSLISSAMPFVDRARDTGQHFSSFKGKYRPLTKILLAYHATANMAVFWHDMLQAETALDTAWHDIAEEELRKLIGHTDSLGQTIAKAGALTEHGEAYFDYQREVLQVRGLEASKV